MSDNQSDTPTEIPSWFKWVGIVAFIWNLLGVMAFAGQMAMTPAILAELSQAEQYLYSNIPLWATIAFACAVIGGALGSLALLLKKTIAYVLLVISLVGVLIQMFHSFFISNILEVFGPGSMIMPIMVLIIAFALVWLSSKAKSELWLK